MRNVRGSNSIVGVITVTHFLSVHRFLHCLAKDASLLLCHLRLVLHPLPVHSLYGQIPRTGFGRCLPRKRLARGRRDRRQRIAEDIEGRRLNMVSAEEVLHESFASTLP